MAPKKDLAALVTQEALAEKVIGKKKRLAQAAEDREFRRIRRGIATLRTPPPPPVERVRGIQPDLPATMTPPFLLNSLGERSSYMP